MGEVMTCSSSSGASAGGAAAVVAAPAAPSGPAGGGEAGGRGGRGVAAEADAYVRVLELEVGQAVRREKLGQFAQLVHVERGVAAARRLPLLLRAALLLAPPAGAPAPAAPAVARAA